MFYRNIFVALLGIGIVSLLVAIINYIEEENNTAIYFSISWFFVIAGCIWYLENDNDKNEQQIQVQLTAFNADLEKLANQHHLDKDKVFNIAQDFLLCKKADLLFKHQPQFSFKCKNEEYVSNKINHLIVQDNIQLLKTQMSIAAK